MKLLYIIGQGHSGSTLMDCILGSHPDFVSSGELRYLGWQLVRTKDGGESRESQNVCTCGQGFRDCLYWAKVFTLIKEESGIDVMRDPVSFESNYFGQFSYKDFGGFSPSMNSKLKAYLARQWVEAGRSYKRLLWIEPKIETWLRNNWLLYECMAKVGGRSIVVDSSKHLLIALLLQQYRPLDVHLIFIHRSLEGLVASAKRRSSHGRPFDLEKTIRAKTLFETRVKRYKHNIPGLKFFDVSYEEFVSRPADFLHDVAVHTGASLEYSKQANDSFYIDPSTLHLVAGNPMRYNGRQLVTYDERWRSELSDLDRRKIKTYNV